MFSTRSKGTRIEPTNPCKCRQIGVWPSPTREAFLCCQLTERVLEFLTVWFGIKGDAVILCELVEGPPRPCGRQDLVAHHRRMREQTQEPELRNAAKSNLCGVGRGKPSRRVVLVSF